MTIPHKGTTRIRISLPWNPWNFLIYELLDEFLYVFRIPVNRTVRMKTNPSKDWIRRVGLEDPSHHTNWSSSRGPQSSLNAGRSLSPGKISLPYNFSDSILNLKFVKSLFFTHLFLLYLLIPQSVQFSCSVMFDSLRPHESQHARPPQQIPIGYLFCIWWYKLPWHSLHTSHLLLYSPHVHKSVLYVRFSIAALQINLSVPTF